MSYPERNGRGQKAVDPYHRGQPQEQDHPHRRALRFLSARLHRFVAEVRQRTQQAHSDSPRRVEHDSRDRHWNRRRHRQSPPPLPRSLVAPPLLPIPRHQAGRRAHSRETRFEAVSTVSVFRATHSASPVAPPVQRASATQGVYRRGVLRGHWAGPPGLEQQGWRVLFANDIDPDKAEIYRENFIADHFKLGDIHKLAPADIPDCELFTASFPCNDLSIAGSWTGLNGKESSAFWGLIQILKGMGQRRPPLVMLENVLGFLQAHRGKDFETALLALNGLGYTVDAFILNALHWVPQSRVRLFVVAKTVNAGGSPNPFAMESDTRPDPLCVFINAHPNVRWDIRGLPRLPKPRLALNDIVEDLPDDDPHWWDKRRSEYFFNQLSERHLKAARMMIGEKTYRYATAFRRVRYGRSMAELRTEYRRRLAPSHLSQRVA
ncbi:MAG: DNA (cytosine-5-)-methyltransferase [Planctomycetota bacterium]